MLYTLQFIFLIRLMNIRCTIDVILACRGRNFTVKMRHKYRRSLNLVLSCRYVHQEHCFYLQDCT